ncbi:barstar family protein [Parasedimentitalea maritima]|uniref:barstar family protein n=1 Tax=Parasedimentitalea maritima TaxID=2578117 RepID=UPI001BB1B3FF|nr:barstar family protein [Zongyanglinia marina]
MNSISKVVEIDGSAVVNWSSFHDQFSTKMGFPAFYGRNGNAWIDCMTSVDCPEDGLSSVTVIKGATLTLQVSEASSWATRRPEVWAAFQEMTAFVNWRRIEQNEGAVLALSYYA